MSDNQFLNKPGLLLYHELSKEQFKEHVDNDEIHISGLDKSKILSAYEHATSAHAPNDSERNTIEIIKKNGITITPNANREIDITVPTKTSELTNDAGFITKDTTYNPATQTTNGLMSASDKLKLDNIEEGANRITIDSTLSSSSTNPVQNKVVNSALSDKVSTSRTVNGKALSTDIILSAGDVGADAIGSASKSLSDSKTYTDTQVSTVQDIIEDHTINADIHFTLNERNKLSGIESGAQKNTVTGVKGNSESTYRTGNINITKANIGLGNVDNTSDANKPVSTAQKTAIDTAFASANDYTDEAIADLINGAPTTLDTLKEIADAMTENESVVNALEDAIGIKANASDLTSHTGNKSNPHGVTKSQLGLGSVENKSSATIRGELTKENVTTALGYTPPTQDTTYGAADSSLGLVKTGGDVTISNGTITVNDDSHNHVISNIDNLQTTLDGKQNSINGAASTITSSNLTADRALISNSSGKVTVSSITSTELYYLDGVTSNVQSQLNNKASTSNLDKKSDYRASSFTPQSAEFYAKICTISLPISYSDIYLEFDMTGRTLKKFQKVKCAVYKANTDVDHVALYISGHNGNTFDVRAYRYIDATNGGYVEIWCKVTSWDALTILKKTFAANGDYYKHVTWNMEKSTAYPTESETIILVAATLEQWSGNAETATKATKDGSGNTITSTYVTKTDLNSTLTETKSTLQASIDSKAKSDHTHNYAGSSSVGGSANSAVKLDSSAGSATQPVYFSGGKPVATTYTLGKSVPSDAKFTDTTYSVASTTANGLMSADDKKHLGSLTSTVYSLGSFGGKTVADLQASLITWLEEYSNITNASVKFSAHHDWITGWNSGDTTKTISAGGAWTVTNIAPYTNSNYAQLRIAYYENKRIVYVVRHNGVWGNVLAPMFTDDIAEQSKKVLVSTTNQTSMTQYRIPLRTSTNDDYTSLLQDNGLYYGSQNGTESVNGRSQFVLGNSTSTGTAGNKHGEIVLYGNSSGYTSILPSNNGTNSISINLPSETGTLALTKDVFPKTGGNVNGNITTINPSDGESSVGARFGDNKRLYIYGNNTSGTRGLYDTNSGKVITVTDTAITFHGKANSALKADSADVATKASQDGSGNVITSTYETKTNATSKLTEAKAYADTAATTAATKIKNDLLNGAGAAYDTLKELGELIDTNTSAIDALETVAASKASSTHKHSVSHTPAGTVSKPTFTGSAVDSGAPSGTTSVYSITGVGSAPSLTVSVTNRCLKFTWSAGSVPTRSSVTVATDNHTHSVTASGSVSQPTFTGTVATLNTGIPI